MPLVRVDAAALLGVAAPIRVYRPRRRDRAVAGESAWRRPSPTAASSDDVGAAGYAPRVWAAPVSVTLARVVTEPAGSALDDLSAIAWAEDLSVLPGSPVVATGLPP